MKIVICILLFLLPFGLKGEAVTHVAKPRFQFSVVPLAGPERVEFEMLISNEEDFPILFEFPTSQLYEISVANQSGQQVYLHSKGRYFLQALQTITIEPHQTFRKVETWDYQVNGVRIPEGEYTVTATLLPRNLNDKPITRSPKLVSKKEFSVPAVNPVIRNVKVKGSNGGYLVTGETKAGSIYYTVEDGHVEFITEKLINTTESTDWKPFTVDIHISEDKLPNNGTLILNIYEHDNRGQIINNYPVILERFY